MKPLLLVALSALTCCLACGQQNTPSILLMTGKVISGKVTKEDSLYIYYDYIKPSGKTKPKKLDWERVFSCTDETGTERVIYVSDTAIGNYFTEEEMRHYIRGEQDAMNGYHAHWTIWVGIPITGGLGFVLNSSPLVFAVPFVYMVSASMPKYRMEAKSISDANLLRQPAYILGYERTARSKRLFKSILSGVVGAGVGMAVGQMMK